MAFDEPIVAEGGPPGFGGYGGGGMLPWYLVVPVQLASAIWEFGVVAIVAFPFWIIIFGIAAFDWILDWVFILSLGLVCKPCAGIFIWVLNIAMIPIMIIGYI